MKTYTVPVFIGIKAKNKKIAIEMVMNFMEYALMVSDDGNEIEYCDVGAETEIFEQKEKS